jgi:hypothetical protein
MAQYQLGIPLRGIIYLHRITDNKFQGSTLRNFQMFQSLCGEEALGNVVLATTMWDKLSDRAEGLERDQQLRSDFWSLMEDRGSDIVVYDGSKAMAETMIALLLAKDQVVLSIQRELMEEQKQLKETSAGRLMVPAIVHASADTEERMHELQRFISKAGDNAAKVEELQIQLSAAKREMRRQRRDIELLSQRVAEDTKEQIAKEKRGGRWRGGLQIFASVTGLAVSVVFNLLPALGVAL